VNPLKSVNKAATWVSFVFLAVQLAGCTWPVDRRVISGSGRSIGDASDSALRNLCDVDRIRARTEALNRFEVDKLRGVAVKISKNVSQADISDLLRLEKARDNGRDLGSNIHKRRIELIEQIYSEAISRAGFKAGSSSKLEDSELQYAVEVDPLSSGNESYVNLVRGQLELSRGIEGNRVGAVSEVALGVYPDQTRYWVTLSRIYRFDTQPGGLLSPLYELVSLSQYIEEMLPSQCASVGSSLDPESFNTVSGLRRGEE
jgi:hypothetical protein